MEDIKHQEMSLEKIGFEGESKSLGEVSIKLEESKFDRKRFELNSLIVSSLNYDVVTKEGKPCKKTEKRKRILHDVNLDIKKGTLTAILGPSGAGKVSDYLSDSKQL